MAGTAPAARFPRRIAAGPRPNLTATASGSSQNGQDGRERRFVAAAKK